jgi:hypothetical protein
MNICKQREKKSAKLIIRDIFLSFVKNQWIKTKPKLNLCLCMAKQCNTYQMNIYKQRERKVPKTVKSLKGYNSSEYWSTATIFEIDL